MNFLLKSADRVLWSTSGMFSLAEKCYIKKKKRNKKEKTKTLCRFCIYDNNIMICIPTNCHMINCLIFD